jgi:UDP-glucuronate decarboxylase
MLKKHLHPIITEDLDYIISQKLPWDNFKDKTILITGANGFLPSYIVYTLLRLNDDFQLNLKVIALVRNKSKALDKFAFLIQRNDFELLVQDVCKPIEIASEIHYIIHAASQASPKYYGVDPVGTLNANVLGTSNLLMLAAHKKVDSFLYFSSSEVYGMVSEDKIPTRESDYGYIDIANVRACYAESKRMGETMCVSWMHQFHVPAKIVRPFHTYGPGMLLDDGRVYADFIADIYHRRDIVMKSDGSAQRAFCYLSDATFGFFTILLEGKNGESYNLGNPSQEVSILELAQQMVAIFPERNLKVIRKENSENYIPSSVSRNCPDISKLKALGWSPVTSIKEGFKKTLISYE